MNKAESIYEQIKRLNTPPPECYGCKSIDFYSDMYPCSMCRRGKQDLYEPIGIMNEEQIKKYVFIPINQLHSNQKLAKKQKAEEKRKAYQHKYYMDVVKPKRQANKGENNE